ncbi:MAG: hypothetical protein EOP82_20985 [Variovorax sp.]|nr:MAG: hypothetical protein EOP82_20985 [Variovorax sp.]
MTTRTTLGSLWLISLLLAGPALAQSATSGADARAQRERATCDGVQQDKAACLREAGAARQEAGRNGLTGASAASYDANAMARCKLQPAADQADCEARLRGGAGSTTGGSVMGGGVIRETVTPVPAPATK